MSFHNSSRTDYGKMMELKSRQYESLITRAEIQRRDSGGMPTKMEAKFYNDAAKVCEEIRDLNMGQMAEYHKWDGRATDCLDNAKEILVQIDPNFNRMYNQPAQPAQQDMFSSMMPPTIPGYNAPAPSYAPPAPSYSRPAPAPTPARKPAPAPAAPKKPAPAPAPAPKPAENTEGDTEKNGRKGTPVTTASGFTTYNSCKDVPADVIESWFKDQPKHDFSDVTGMDETKKILSDVIMNLGWTKTKALMKYDDQKCIFFYGPPGTGKTYIIEAFISELMKKGYNYMQLTGGDIHASLVGVAEKTVNIAFKEAIDKAPCILFIDEFEGVCMNRSLPNLASHEKKTTVAFLEAYNEVKESGAQVLLVGATNFPEKVDGAMMDRIFPSLVPLPDPASRASFFERKYKKIAIDDDLTFDYMGEKTENCSYRDLGKIASFISSGILSQLKEQYSVYDENGMIDVDKSDEIISAAIENGEVRLTREMFDSVISNYKPSNKTENLLSLEKFEMSLSKAGEE